MTPWEEASLIEACHLLAEECGFKLEQDFRYGSDKICLQAADDAQVWAKDLTLDVFGSWGECRMYLSGYRKAMMYVAMKGTWK